MAESRVNLTLINSDWNLIEVDPDNDGYIEMFVDQLNTTHATAQWCTISTISDNTSALPLEPNRFDYDIYVRNPNASSSNPFKLAITRL